MALTGALFTKTNPTPHATTAESWGRSDGAAFIPDTAIEWGDLHQSLACCGLAKLTSTESPNPGLSRGLLSKVTTSLPIRWNDQR